MPAAVRVGDINQRGGLAMTGANSVIVDGVPVAVHPCIISPHGKKKHKHAVTVIGSGTVLAEGKPVVYVGVPETCGHSRVTGSSTVIVGA